MDQRKKRHILQDLVPSAKKECIADKKQKRHMLLHRDPNTVFHERPLLYANCPLPVHVASTTACERRDCPDIVIRSLPHPEGDMTEVSGSTTAEFPYARLLRPFADVFCLFYEDFGGFDSIMNCLQSWMETGQLATIPVY
jgi:hypothetical protein